MASRKTVWRWWLGGAGTILLLVVALVLLRQPLLGAAISASLERAGAGDVQFDVRHASPWLVELENVGFTMRTQRVGARKVTMVRQRWWQPSLGSLQVDGLVLPLRIDGSGTDPWNWATYAGGERDTTGGGGALPIDEISVDGQIVVQVSSSPDRPVTVKFSARESGSDRWEGRIETEAPGLHAKATGSYALPTGKVSFQIESVDVDLALWHSVLKRLVILPGGSAWEIAGTLSGSATGTWADDKLVASGDVRVKDGRVRYEEYDLTAEGIQAQFRFTDFNEIKSDPGRVGIAALSTGKMVFTNIETTLAFLGPDRLAVDAVRFDAFGGTVRAEPFQLFLSQRELDATLTAERLDIAQLMALTDKVPANAKGRVDGRLPIHLDSAGVRLGTGWLALTQGVPAELQLKAEGLLTGGTDARSPSYQVLKKVESGLLRLRLNHLRLEVRPPNAPPGRSAVVRLQGEPVDPEVKAPVTLDLNVNGPIERLINLGMDDRVRIGTGR